MGVAKTNGAGMAYAASAAKRIDDLLTDSIGKLSRLVDFFEGRYYFELQESVTLKAEEESGSLTLPMIPQGYTFIPSHIAITAPEGTQLEIFLNNFAESNLVEVAANVQVYAEQIAGWQVKGPIVLACRFRKAKAAGTATISLSGLLIPIDASTHGHRP